MDFPRCTPGQPEVQPTRATTTVSNDLFTLILPLYSMNPSFLNLFMEEIHARSRRSHHARQRRLRNLWQYPVRLFLVARNAPAAGASAPAAFRWS